MELEFINLEKPILLASDHGGFHLKQSLQSKLSNLNFKDLGPDGDESVDYPDFAHKLCQQLDIHLSSDLNTNPNVMGLLICGSGQGVAMTANKYKSIRAALCWNEESARLARQHNNANVLCLGARLMEENKAYAIINEFFKTPFEGGRHLKRVTKITSPFN